MVARNGHKEQGNKKRIIEEAQKMQGCNCEDCREVKKRIENEKEDDIEHADDLGDMILW